MKKNLFFLCALICSVSLFSACSDDDEDTTWQNIPDSTSENTTLKINGSDIEDASASLDIKSAEAGVLTLTNAVYGHDNITVDVALTKSNDSIYVFEGTTNIDGAISKSIAAVDKGLTVTAKGSVQTNGKLTVDVTTSGWGTISGIYSGDSLKMTVNGTESKYYPVTLTATGESKATLDFEKIPNVVNEFSIEVALTEGYKFEGTAEKSKGYNINVSGTVVKNVLTIDVTTSGYATYNKTYSGDKLVYTYNKELTPGKAFKPNVDLSFGESTVDISLTNAVKGVYVGTDGVIKIKGVKYTKAANSETYSFSGTASPEGYKASIINFEGTVSPDKVLIFNVDYNIQSDVVGKWNMATENGMGKTFFDFKTNSGMVNLPDDIYSLIPEDMKAQLPQQMPDQAFTTFVKQMLGKYTMYLNSVEFKPTGKIAFTYTDMKTGKETTMEQNFIHYSINDKGKLLLVPNLDELMGMIMSEPASAQSASLKSYDPYDPSGIFMGDGIPFNYRVSNNELCVTIDKGVIEPLGNILVVFLPMFGAALPADVLEMVNVILPGALGMLGETPVLEVGIYMNK